MKIGLFVYSLTGNTLSVVQRLEEQLAADGHEAVIDQITSDSDKPSASHANLLSSPDPAGYDCLVIAGPVHAFSAATIMKKYLSELKDLEGCPTALLVTHQFPKPWLGGNRAIRQMKKLVITKNGRILSSFVIDWSNRSRENEIMAAVTAISGQAGALT